MQIDIPAGVGVTSVFVAYARAVESRRPDRLFADPLAELFAARGERALSALAADGAGDDIWRFMGGYFAVRTRFFDEYLLNACAQSCRQVVLLGAGLDTRAFRLAWPCEVRLFELDRPDVLGFKEDVLVDSCSAPACERITVAADLCADWGSALTAAGFRADEPTAWLAEGVLIYPADGDCERLLQGIHNLSALGSRLALSRTGAGAGLWHQHRSTLEAIDESAGFALARRWKPPPSRIDLPGLLALHGWEVTRHDITTLSNSYGRPLASTFAATSAGFITALCLERSSTAVRGA